MSSDNEIVIEAWNTILFEKFCRYRHLLVDSLARHSDVALDLYPYPTGARVLDVGCGFGDSTLRIARGVGAGEAVGVDCAANFIRAAEADRDAAKVKNARFFVADVQSEDLRGPYDHAFARFGTMFFDLPGAAMRNVRRALKPGGTAFFSTINRNLKSFAFAIVGAEYVLGLLPRGTHEYAKLIRPAELAAWCRKAGLEVTDLTGLHHNPATGAYWLDGNVDVNYFACATRSERRQR